ncbi:uncharacterized protein LOC119191103 [Manduca sexta]|uniref:uncharacterized protein LOC119191103 n=1 Tax=Manduca sexta TaxID=7130 RepID=UPI00188EB703|nr:uncharacterized protein LOC119191103 [Manduca sexta]
MTTDTFETTSNPPGSVRSFSVFGDSACGEPLLAQHLVVDFTPDDKLDTDYIQRKVCAFWEFVDVTPELRDILVLPDSDLFKVSESSDFRPDVKQRKQKSFTNKVVSKARTAVSMLEFVEERGLIDRTFESRLPQSTCSLGSREYHESQLPMDFDKATLHEKQKNGNLYQGHMKYSKRTQTPDFRHGKSNAKVQNMCRKMQQWDQLHPKCMQCPRHLHASMDAHAHAHRHKRAS